MSSAFCSVLILFAQESMPLALMPPLAAWRYDLTPAPGTAEALLSERYLVPRDWT